MAGGERDVRRRYREIADGFGRRLDGVRSGQWDAPSPCVGWTAQDVVVHVVETHRRVLAALDGSPLRPVGPDGDLAAEWAGVRAEVEAALDDPSTASTTVGAPFSPQPFASLVGGLLAADTLVHTWDLARATGQDDQLPEDAIAEALAFLTPLDNAIRRPGGFAAKIEPVVGADLQTCFLNFCGREA